MSRFTKEELISDIKDMTRKKDLWYKQAEDNNDLDKFYEASIMEMLIDNAKYEFIIYYGKAELDRLLYGD